jgi:vanillate O-demethylase monooxygenase subunit
MSDRCVHRRFPLSQAPSRLDGDRVVCGYHGFT